MTPEYFVAAFHQGSRDASRDVDELGLDAARRIASKMRRGEHTPYADGYCVRVGELMRHPVTLKG